MSLQSSIEWTDATWNPVRGCTKVSPGCKHCYAETFAERFRGGKDTHTSRALTCDSCLKSCMSRFGGKLRR